MSQHTPIFKHTPPRKIGKIAVEQSGDPTFIGNEWWVTLHPTSQDIGGLWEFSLTTGRILNMEKRA